ncbi:hypothetical protein PIB30_110790, partial [Stylosanthes scabra]|nr:hypothetical protein [Stylosanthes scabra]
ASFHHLTLSPFPLISPPLMLGVEHQRLSVTLSPTTHNTHARRPRQTPSHPPSLHTQHYPHSHPISNARRPKPTPERPLTQHCTHPPTTQSLPQRLGVPA